MRRVQLEERMFTQNKDETATWMIDITARSGISSLDRVLLLMSLSNKWHLLALLYKTHYIAKQLSRLILSQELKQL